MIVLTLLLACTPDEASTTAGDADPTTPASTLDSTPPLVDSGTPPTGDDDDDDDGGGGGGALAYYHDVQEATLVLDGHTEHFDVDPMAQSAFATARLEPEAPGDCAPSTTFELFGSYDGELPLVMRVYLDDDVSEQRALPIQANDLPFLINRESWLATDHFISGGTLTYELLPDGSHQYDLTGALLCNTNDLPMDPNDPADCAPTSLSLHIVGTINDFGTFTGKPGTILVNGVPRCE